VKSGGWYGAVSAGSGGSEGSGMAVWPANDDDIDVPGAWHPARSSRVAITDRWSRLGMGTSVTKDVKTIIADNRREPCDAS
jgi:hypothetical protein